MKNNILSHLTHKIIFLVNKENSEIKAGIWEKELESFAQIRPACDNNFVSLENMGFGSVISEECFIFTTRYDIKINKNMRIDFHGQIFEIKRLINENMKNKILKIIALEI